MKAISSLLCSTLLAISPIFASASAPMLLPPDTIVVESAEAAAEAKSPVNLEVNMDGTDASIAYRLPEVRLVTIVVRDNKDSMVRFLQIGGQSKYRNLPLNLNEHPAGNYMVILEAGSKVYELPLRKN